MHTSNATSKIFPKPQFLLPTHVIQVGATCGLYMPPQCVLESLRRQTSRLMRQAQMNRRPPAPVGDAGQSCNMIERATLSS